MNYTLNQLFIANSVYALFLYCLKFHKKIDETLFLLGPSCTFANLNHALPIFSPPKPEQLPLVRSFIHQQVYLLLSGRKVPCYGNVETVFSDFFVNNFPFYPISDGLRDTVTFPEYLKTDFFEKCYTVRYSGGLDLKHPRLEYLNIQALWDRLSLSEKKRMNYIFCVEDSFFDVLKYKKQVLITQPLSEDNICSEADKIEIYKQMLSNYQLQDVVLKPHPREWTDWRKIFPEVTVLPKHIPAEMLSLLVPDLNKAITFFSTATFNMLKPEQIDFYAKDFKKLRYYSTQPRKEGERVYKPISSFDVEETYRSYTFNWLRIPDEKGYFYLDSER